ncbi:Elongation factor G1, mitochondrial, putative [Trypanosoma equiperdum]|uniref:Elongation factor G, mitochondrial n=3 Tax=Trypanozoon TaxID=39700 RepID=Q38BA0_TRYB2|nr:Mitochondrial elongation factor G, putative [Trypanosoma brucei gambiense DAL972]XP_822748.1 mitochondrial elongation factor G [Trypanosoma brucei brucei TREU927]EAN77920.1 Mitochondrial elongation factor G, putative [Trypanosoma brucei brucei TREU927]CBH15521.1 Mitochondrial elongation factor G, putative [Trypanosoma brucei gambiense DAL972]SCU65133.1 Elongation factor G1, mitochondrial, putative [Trypanosoma equiperdum]|eukprot:XP_011777785.1 Mitochondrial elongation factor G, putative [Trypanosoma brucei gambiense DAL972]
MRRFCDVVFYPNRFYRLASSAFLKNIDKLRNIGISAHIDSGKTTVTERILFYTGRIDKIHEVKGGSEVGATMDSMELEKERGITIRSAATQCKWGDHLINIIDTPGHVDFTIEVERALRVLDGAVMLMCGVGGVQSQTLTVDRQMKRYGVPRVCFINKLDRDNANPRRALEMARERLGVNAAFIHLNMGVAQDFEGVVDVIESRAVYFDGKNGEKIRFEDIPSYIADDVVATRKELISRLADCDAEMEDVFLNDVEPTAEQIHSAIRRTTIANKFVPVLVGSAYKNKGIQLLLDAVCRYLPSPMEKPNSGYSVTKVKDDEGNVANVKGEIVPLATDDEKPLVAAIFKLEETKKTGLLNYIRVYQGKMRREHLMNVRSGKTFLPQKLVRMHANSTDQIDEVRAGDICAIQGEIDASSGDTIVKAGVTAGQLITCEDMYVPPRVISASVKINNDRDSSKLRERMGAFMREDPTFCFYRNTETNEDIVEGMGELHLDIYIERLKREYDLEVVLGKPTVNYREVITERKEFDFVYKRQSGGAGQWAQLKGFIDVLPIDMSVEKGVKNKVTVKCSNGDVREALQKSVVKQLERKIFVKGELMGAPVWGVHFHLSGGAMHEVDSTDLAFRNATQELWETLLPQLKPTLVEPYMVVEITVPSTCMTDVSTEFAKREGVVTETTISGTDAIIRGETALDTMFGFISDLRRLTKGQGDFGMQFKEYRPMQQYKAQCRMDERNKDLGRKLYRLSGQ